MEIESRVEVVVGYPFVPHVDQGSRPSIQDPKGFLKRKFESGGEGNIERNGIYKEMGYAYDFRPYLKRFVFKQNGSWWESYAPNKTLLRSVTYGKIDELVELPNS